MSVLKQQLLETITTISKLILLSFKPIDTKVAIRDHKLVLCDPINNKYFINSTITQSIDRYWNNDSREDIYVLNHVIVNFIELYIQPYKNRDSVIYDQLLKLTKYLCVGLKRLQRTYGPCNVSLVIQYYINILTSVTDNTYSNDMLFTLQKNNIETNDDNTKPLDYSTMLDTDKITNFWSDQEIKSIADQFSKCFKDPKDLHEREPDIFGFGLAFGDDQSNSLNCTPTSSNGTPFPVQFNSIPTTTINYATFDDCKLPIPKNKSNALINGYLVGIEKILELMDDKFTTLLDKSVNGSK